MTSIERHLAKFPKARPSTLLQKKKQEMTDLMEIMAAFGAKHGVVFHDDERRAA